MEPNQDPETVAGFGREWESFDHAEADTADQRELFASYFSLFPWAALPPQAAGFDLGCGSGRWARLVAPRVHRLHLVDPSPRALEVARRNLAGTAACEFHLAGVDNLPFPDSSMDFGYSLGVLHHLPDLRAALISCARVLKPGAPFLVYIYYALENRPAWYRRLWRASEWLRQGLSRLPYPLRYALSQTAAAAVYFPLARSARLMEDAGADVSGWPLAFYRRRSFYTMRNDALDRFGTRLEKRFTAAQIREHLEAAGFAGVSFRQGTPYWCALGRRR